MLSKERHQTATGPIRADCYCEVDGFEYRLVDTPSRPNDLVLNMLRRSDLVIAPFMSASKAALTGKMLAKHIKKNTLVYGLVTGVEYEVVKAAFTEFPVLDNYLPNAPIFKQQHEQGHLFSMRTQEIESENSKLQEMLVNVMNADGRVSAELVWSEIHTIICDETLRKLNTKRGCSDLMELH